MLQLPAAEANLRQSMLPSALQSAQGEYSGEWKLHMRAVIRILYHIRRAAGLWRRIRKLIVRRAVVLWVDVGQVGLP
jgi:hypothetical protein